VADATSAGMTGAVYVQANWPVDRYVDEAVFVAEASQESGFPIAIVAYADMLAGDARPQLDALARNPRVRGVRMQLHWHENPLYRFASGPDLARDPILQRNVARLADYGWSFDLQVFSGQMAGAAELADACPAVTFVLQHAGMLEDLTPEGIAAWRAGMARLAARPNVASKLSGLGTFLRRNDAAHIAMIVGETLGLFGADRCLFGSNFPIEKLWTSYAELFAAHRAAVPPGDRSAVFSSTAKRVYRLA
jgi:predicted TIM-barrel fold metal-dependent hydrolase